MKLRHFSAIEHAPAHTHISRALRPAIRLDELFHLLKVFHLLGNSFAV